MKFSAGWFKKLFPFAGKREETPLTDEAGAALEETVAEAEEIIEKPGLRKRLMGLFKREKYNQPEESESIGQDEPQAVPATKVLTDVEAAAPIDEAGNGEEVEALPKPGIFARLMGSFRRRKKAVEAEANEEDAGQVAENKDDDQPATEDAPRKGLWALLKAVFSRKSSKQSAAELADAGELFSWGEGQAAVAVDEKGKKEGKVEKVEKAEKGKGGAKEDAKPADQKVASEEEEQPVAGFGARIGVLARNKKVWILLLLVSVIAVVLVVSLTLYQMRTREHARLLELEKKNKQLQEENKKLQAPKKQTITQPPKGPEAPLKNNRAGNQAPGKGSDSTDDCTVSNKEDAAEALKRCIDSFNAVDRR